MADKTMNTLKEDLHIEFGDIGKAAKDLGLSRSMISFVLNGRRSKNSPSGKRIQEYFARQNEFRKSFQNQ